MQGPSVSRFWQGQWSSVGGSYLAHVVDANSLESTAVLAAVLEGTLGLALLLALGGDVLELGELESGVNVGGGRDAEGCEGCQRKFGENRCPPILKIRCCLAADGERGTGDATYRGR